MARSTRSIQIPKRRSRITSQRHEEGRSLHHRSSMPIFLPRYGIGRSVKGCLHFLDKTPIDWYSKLHSTVETATYGSEYIAAKTCTDQIIELRTTLRFLGVLIKNSSFMFGDNENVVNSSSIPDSKLHKRHNALAYHRTREAIAAGILRFHHVAGKTNPADILSKHWDLSSVWGSLRPILFSAYNSSVTDDDKKPRVLWWSRQDGGPELSS